ncbi:hypothetical protein B9Z19DRAFT_28369 [Tuber borchii]|uniref:Secreted protein n=1 Tax=Tuber borchii TaxID=42251 RepID=A0A2T6ZTQ7_TUBBO|nr:hypothetical protein B9Z19DRAFT_28369 [Tuber borchii]
MSLPVLGMLYALCHSLTSVEAGGLTIPYRTQQSAEKYPIQVSITKKYRYSTVMRSVNHEFIPYSLPTCGHTNKSPVSHFFSYPPLPHHHHHNKPSDQR